MRIVILGGHGLIGSLVGQKLTDDGHEVKLLGRRDGVDAVTGAGMSAALEGADVVIDTLNIDTQSKSKSVGFFRDSARNVTSVVGALKIPHLLTVSIYGSSLPESKKNGYYAGKAVQEQVVRDSGVPATIVHSTQWFELADTILKTAKFGPIIVAPHFLSRPVAVDSVAARIAEIAQGPVQANEVVIAGPEERDLHDLVVELAKKRGTRGKILGINPPGMGAMKSGVLIPSSSYQGVGPSFEQWLESH